MSDAALWVHCSLCMALGGRTSGLLITSCGRVVCTTCSSQLRSRFCETCGGHCHAIPLNRKAPSKVLNLFKDASAQLKEAFKNASWQEKQKDSLLEHKTDNIVRLKKEEREGNMELEQLEQELEGLREEMKLLEEEEKALRRMELARKGSEVGEGVDRNLHPRNLNNSESGSRRSGEKLPFTNKPSNFDFLQMKTPQAWYKNKTGFQR